MLKALRVFKGNKEADIYKHVKCCGVDDEIKPSKNCNYYS